MKIGFMVLSCLLVLEPAMAEGPQRKALPSKPGEGSGESTPGTDAAAQERTLPCQDPDPYRKHETQGTLLWGMARRENKDETSSVLVSLDLANVRLRGTLLKDLQVQQGRLVAPAGGAPNLVGAIFQGTSSDGKPVEVALCGAEPDARDPEIVRYRIEVWNAEKSQWQNPCIDTYRVPKPRALPVQGLWDASGARHQEPGRFTFACENGAIAKCIDWGYKPWAVQGGRSLVDLHQACTRMARADYCGDGRSHTREDTPIDMYDGLGLLTRTQVATAGWDPRRASFEAAWTPDGASCLARTRDGHAAETILAECPDRFEASAEELGEGDRCKVRRKGARAAGTLLRNHALGTGE